MSNTQDGTSGLAPLGVALVGFGYSGRTIHAPLLTSTQGVVLRSVVSSNASSVGEQYPDVRVAGSLDEVCRSVDVDAVVIAAPNELHAPLAHAALEAGKHVVIDKPFAVSLSETDSLIQHAAATGLKITAFQNRRWDADFLTLSRLLDEGALGQIAQFESRFDRFRPMVRDRWRERPGPGAGAWFDLGPHLLDQALLLFGQPRSVFADIFVQRHKAEVDDYFHVLLNYDHLRVVLQSGSLVSGRGLRFAIHGDTGGYVKWGFDQQEAQLKQGMRPGQPNWGEDPSPGTLSRTDGDVTLETEVPNERGDYVSFYRTFAEAILHGREPPVKVAQIRSVMAMIELCLESATQRREFQVPPSAV
jgi:predicted dehydrogenase